VRQRPRIVVLAMVATFAVMLLVQALARWSTFHNETFDLAFYGRMAWGPWHLVLWDPVVGAHVLGLHVSLVVLPLGLATFVPGAIVPTLLAAQAGAVAAAAVPFSVMAARRFGPWGALLGAGVWLLYPNIGHVATYEFHPGTLAVLPMAFALDALDRRAPRAFFLAVLGVLACREDLGLCTGFLGVVAMRDGEAMRVVGKRSAILSFGYLAIFLFVLLPLLGPAHGSVQLHFGKWGDSLPAAAMGMLLDPVGVFHHMSEPDRLGYLPRLLAPLAFLPLVAPRWLIPTLPILAVNLMSEWPTTTDLDSHYQTTLLPFLVAASIDGAAILASQARKGVVIVGLFLALGITHALAGGTPIAMDYDSVAFTPDARSSAASRVIREIPVGESVQAPYALMPHLVERELISAAPPPDKNYAWVIFDAWHRDRYAQSEDLLRTSEEPVLRDWLARPEYGLVHVAAPYLVFRRGADPRQLARERGIFESSGPRAVAPLRLAECLSITGWARRDDMLVLDFEATGPCGADLALRIGPGYRPSRVDLLFGGVLSPLHLRTGDRVRSLHPLDDEEARSFDAGELRVGLLRSSGARPTHADPVAVYLSVSAP